MLPKIDSLTNTNSVKKQRKVSLVVQSGPRGVEVAVAVAGEHGGDILGQQFGQSILVRMAVGSGKERVKASFDTRMAEV